MNLGWLRLALKYIAYHRLKTLILIACIFLTAYLPIAIGVLLNQFNQKIVARAVETPIVIGAKGSRVDLALHALYFKSPVAETVPYRHVREIRETGWAIPIPIYSRFTAKGFPIVGTSLDYFDFRQLRIADGNRFVMLGDCVIGSQVAEQHQLRTGDSLLSDRENILDIAGLYPLRMHVRGVLAPANSPDDWAVFVDLKTAWIIQGLGHGHQDLQDETDENKILARDGNKIVASAAVLPYTEITEENVDSFHFHGDIGDFPLSAVIAVAIEEKSETLLIGRYQTVQQDSQIIDPQEVVQQLMSMVFRVKQFFDANALLISVSTLLLLVLVVWLSLKLRDREMETMFKLGSSRGMIALLQIGELGIVFAISGVLVGGAIWFTWRISGDLVQSLLLER